MKYTRLTKEQLEELHPEFINFLASQSIDKKEWDILKSTNETLALQEIDVFSDLIWEKALTNVNFLDHFSENYIFLFKCLQNTVHSIIIKTNNATVNFLSNEGIHWLGENLFSDEVEIQKGTKDISNDRNGSIFSIIEKGGIISKGELYLKLETLLNN